MKHFPDLQGLRGIAIIFVLGFHLKPDIFPNGFVGVDMWELNQSTLEANRFFVLSGFLMAKILSKERTSWESICDFYKRRFIRIIPLYFLVILMAYCCKLLF